MAPEVLAPAELVSDMAEMVTTDSGLRVVVESIPSSAVTSVGVWVKVGSMHESKSAQYCSRGVAHLTEHMVCRGGFSTTSAEMSEQIGLMGGDSNAETERDFTAYWSRVPSSDSERALKMLLDSILDPRMDEDEFPAEINAILDEIDAYEHDPEKRALDMLFERVLWGTPLSMSVGGSRQEFLRAAGPETALPFWCDHYALDRMTVVVVGDVDIQDTLSIVEGKLSEHGDRVRDNGWPVRQVVDYREVHDFVDVNDGPGRTYMYHGVRGVPFSHPLYYPMVVLSSALGDGHNSRANRVIRQKLGLVYSATSSHYAFDDDGMFVIEASSDNLASAQAAINIMRNEVSQIVLFGIEKDELKSTKRSLANEIMLDNDGTFQIMYRLGYGMTAAGWERPVSVGEVAERILSVTADQVQEAAKLLNEGQWSRVEFTEERNDYS